MLPERSDADDGHHRRERRGLGRQLREPEPERQGRHEDDPAAHAEETREHPADEAQADRDAGAARAARRAARRQQAQRHDHHHAGEADLQARSRDPPLQRGSEQDAADGRQADEQRVAPDHVTGDPVARRADRAGDADRGERGRGGALDRDAACDERRHDHDSAADAEERREHAGDGADRSLDASLAPHYLSPR